MIIVLAFLCLAFLLFICGVLLILSAIGYRLRSRRAEIRANRAEGALDESRGYTEKMTELARQAIEVAHEKHFPVETRRVHHLPPVRNVEEFQEQQRRASKGFKSPAVKFCECNVSIRSETWPIACPSCGKLVGDDGVLDADVVE